MACRAGTILAMRLSGLVARASGVVIISAVISITLMMLTGSLLPTWQVIYATNETPGPNWVVRVMDVNRQLSYRFMPGLRPGGLPFISPDRRFMTWVLPSGELQIQDIHTKRLHTPGVGYAPAWSPDSRTLVYRQDSSIYVLALDESGAPGPAVKVSADLTVGRSGIWSPDGTRLAFQIYGISVTIDSELYTLDLQEGDFRNLSNRSNALDGSAVWSPDGDFLAFISSRDGNPEIYIVDADGRDIRRMTDEIARDDAPSWSPDGSQLAFISDRSGFSGLYVLPVADPANVTGPLDNLLRSTIRWSPDGTRLVYISTRDGRGELYVVHAGGGSPRRLTNNIPNYLMVLLP